MRAVGASEDCEAGHEDLFRADAIPERARGENERCERERVGADDPLQFRYAAAERRADAAQSRIDDRDVELNDAEAETHRRKRERRGAS
jgi:hypothetical protein